MQNNKEYYSKEELTDRGFSIGKDVKISRLTQIYCSKLTVGDNVRIDDFCVLTGDIRIGSHVHIGNFAGLYGNGILTIDDLVGMSSKCTIYTATDDFSGEYMTGPMISSEFTNITKGSVTLHKHVILGTGTTILPNVVLEEGAACGAMSLIRKSIPKFEIHAGNPARFVKNRSKNLLDLEKKWIASVVQ